MVEEVVMRAHSAQRKVLWKSEVRLSGCRGDRGLGRKMGQHLSELKTNSVLSHLLEAVIQHCSLLSSSPLLLSQDEKSISIFSLLQGRGKYRECKETLSGKKKKRQIHMKCSLFLLLYKHLAISAKIQQSFFFF